MDPERWRKVEALYEAARGADPERRRAVLDEGCAGDDALRREVESLLAHGANAERFLEVPAAEMLPEAARLAVGGRVSHYEIQAKLGEGGMGVVYKARDTRLGRSVALKFVKAQFSERFEREARAIAALNHPHIATLHDVGEHDGAPYLTMEFVEGRPLKGPRPVKEVIEYGVQIADALAAAHAAGIVHRDLKPANILVTERGSVKVLDFGLAKLRETGDGAHVTATLTGVGAGTPGYMSPEQIDGKPADARSDIFAFGCVLYELASGRHAFEGDSVGKVLAATATTQPKPLAGVPEKLDELIRRCLRKDPERRFQHMDDAAVALQDLKEETAPPPRVVRTRRRLLLATGAVVLLVVAGWLAWGTRSSSLPPQRVVPVTNYAGNELNPSLSPDGSQVAFCWNGEKRDNWDIYVTNAGGGGRPLQRTTGPATDWFPAWSPDGTQIAFVRIQGSERAIYVVHPLAGEARKLADLSPIAHNGGPSWDPTGKWLAVTEWYEDKTSAIELIPVQSGARRKLISGPFAGGRCAWPSFSPDGRSLAYALVSSLGFGDLYLLELDAGLLPRRQPQKLSQYAGRFRGITWTPDGRSVIYGAGYHVDNGSDKNYLFRARVDVPGPPQRVEVTGEFSTYPSVSRIGSKLAYEINRSVSRSDIWRLEPGSAPVNIFPSTAHEWDPQFSPDGKKIAYVSAGEGSDTAIWVANSDGSSPVQLTERMNRGRGSPCWSPDGRWLAYDGQSEDGHWDIFVIDAAGGQPRRLTPYPSDEHIPSWSRDGKWVYFRSAQAGDFEVWRIPANGEGRGEQLTVNGGVNPQESYDGKTVYYGKGGGLFARSLAGGPEWRVLESIGGNAYWPVKEGIFYVAPAPSVGPGTFELRFFEYETKKSRLLDRFQMGNVQKLSVSPDGKTFLFSGGALGSGNMDLMLIENFR